MSKPCIHGRFFFFSVYLTCTKYVIYKINASTPLTISHYVVLWFNITLTSRNVVYFHLLQILVFKNLCASETYGGKVIEFNTET